MPNLSLPKFKSLKFRLYCGRKKNFFFSNSELEFSLYLIDNSQQRIVRRMHIFFNRLLAGYIIEKMVYCIVTEI